MSGTFASGGVIQGGSLTIASGSIISKGTIIAINGSANKASQSFSQLAKQTKKLTWELQKNYVDPEYCHNRRGGPRSKIHCEVPKSIPHDFHMGRSRSGGWFSWKEREC